MGNTIKLTLSYVDVLVQRFHFSKINSYIVNQCQECFFNNFMFSFSVLSIEAQVSAIFTLPVDLLIPNDYTYTSPHANHTQHMGTGGVVVGWRVDKA